MRITFCVYSPYLMIYTSTMLLAFHHSVNRQKSIRAWGVPDQISATN